MTLRSVHDAANVEWRVWDVRPSWAAAGQWPPGLAPHEAARPALSAHLSEGWLAMQSSVGERRRVVPIPEGWHDLGDDALLRLVDRAVIQPPGHRRFVE
jgi:hypothetical protein